MRKVAAVTGGGHGIGRAIAFAFAQAGYGVSIADIHEAAGLETVKLLNSYTEHVVFTKVDVSKEDERRS